MSIPRGSEEWLRRQRKVEAHCALLQRVREKQELKKAALEILWERMCAYDRLAHTLDTNIEALCQGEQEDEERDEDIADFVWSDPEHSDSEPEHSDSEPEHSDSEPEHSDSE